MKGRIYKIVNTKTTDIYIGSTTQEIKNRFKTHRSNSKTGKTEDLYECMRKYGVEHFSIELLEEFELNSKADLGVKEREYYEKLNPSLNMKAPSIATDKEYGRIYKLFYVKDLTKFYIGSTTKNIKSRLGEHRYASNTGTTPIYVFMRENGKENFDIEYVEEHIRVDQLIIRENYWIAELKPTLNKNTNLCITDQERDRLKYIKNREKRLQQVSARRLLKRDEINAQKNEHYHINKERINGKDKQKRQVLRETEFLPYDEKPNFTKENLQRHTIFELKGFAKRLGLKRTPRLKDKVIDKILAQQDVQFP
jgi:Uri superfamily endonuclease